MAPPSRIVELASIIQENTILVDAYITSNNLPSPSFDVSYPPILPLPPHIQAIQETVLEASDELTALLQGPVRSIAGQPHNSWVSAQAINRFGIATSFPVGETSTFAEIARTCSISESDTRRIIRHAMTYYIFREPSPGVVAHTASSKALASIPLLGQLVGFMTSEMWPSATRLVDAMEKWPGSEEPNEAGFALAYDVDVPMFDVVSRDPKRAAQMAGAMAFTHSGPSNNVKHLIDNFDWRHAADGLLVDIGGASGAVAIEIARSLPRIKCIVQDLPDVVAGAEIPEDLRSGDRLKFMAHDFFHEQPLKVADTYLLRWVLHDWSDKYVVKILRNLIPALKKGARVVVSELCLPPPCVLTPYRERSMRRFDLAMKEIQNAKERDAEDWAQVFKAADSKFKFQDIIKPAGSALSIMCAVWEGNDLV